MFSKSTEYALRAVIYIAKKSNDQKKLGLDMIAKAIDSPKSYTAKILQQLTTGERNIVSSISGPGGGFFMTEKDKQRAVRDILRAMGEDQILDKCVLGLSICSDKNPCAMHRDYKEIKSNLIHLFEEKTISQLANDYSDLHFRR